MKKKILLILYIAILTFPITAFGLIDFCFSVSFTVLTLVLGWPSMLLYETFPTVTPVQEFSSMLVFGFVVNFLIALAISIFLGIHETEQGLPFYKKFKLPILFSIFIFLLLIISFIDPTCWR